MSSYGYVEPKLATYERWCVRHSSPLIDDLCAYRHGAGNTCQHWYLVREGKVEAECLEDRVRWLRGPQEPESERPPARKIVRVRVDSERPKRNRLDPEAKQETKRRKWARRRERQRAAQEGREPAPWARLQASAPPIPEEEWLRIREASLRRFE